MKGFMYYIAYIPCFFFSRLSGKVHIKGIRNIPKDKNFIIVANHISLMDPWIIGSIIPITTPVHWFTTEMLYDPINVRQYLPKGVRKGWLGSTFARIVIFTMRHTHTIKVAVQSHGWASKEEKRARKLTNSAAFREANKVLSQRGGVVGIFAQRGRSGSIDNTSSSCLLLARKNNVPILPIHLSKGVVIIMKPEDIGKTINLAYGKQDRNRIAKELMDKILREVQ